MTATRFAGALLATALSFNAANAQQLNKPETLTGIQEFAAFIAKREVPSDQVEAKTKELVTTYGRAWSLAVMDAPRGKDDMYCTRVSHDVKDQHGAAQYTAALCIKRTGPRDVTLETGQKCTLTAEVWGMHRKGLTCF